MSYEDAESGDYLQIDAQGHTQKLKNYLINEKIPEGTKRPDTLLIADGTGDSVDHQDTGRVRNTR